MLLLLPHAAAAQPGQKLYRIGLLNGGAPPASGEAPGVRIFRERLIGLGYQADRDFLLEQRWAHFKRERSPALAAELIQLGVDVIVTFATPEAIAAKSVTTTIPIVMAVSADPVGAGVVASLARPGGNVTGLSLDTPEVTGKRPELLREIIGPVRMAAVHAGLPTFPVVVEWIKENRRAGQALGLAVRVVDATDAPERWDGVLAGLARDGVRGLALIEGPPFFVNRQRIAELALKHRLSTIFPFREQAEAGGLSSYGARLPDLYRRAASIVDKIFRGARPADIPVEQPTTFELVINLKTAEALGLTIPPSLLSRADQVIR